MAATRLIALHINKGKTLARCLADRLDYSKNDAKTNDGEHISSYECNPYTAAEEWLLTKEQYSRATGRKQRNDVIAYQIRQSFKPDEITPEEANRVGYDLAMRWTKGKYAFVVCTHTDKRHIHNHIIYNSTSLDCTRKFENFSFSGLALQRLSDVICAENDLSIISKKPCSEREKYIYDYPEKKSIRSCICDDIDACLNDKPKSFDDLLAKLGGMGYEYKDGKRPSIKGKNQKRFVRFDTLGEGYSITYLKAVIGGEKERVARTSPARKSVQRHADNRPQLLIQYDEALKNKGIGYQRWATKFNVKQKANALLFINEHGIKDFDELAQKAKEKSEKADTLLANIKADEGRLKELAALRNHIINYAKSKNVFAQYKASGYNKDFYENNRELLTLRKAANDYFNEYKKTHLGEGGKPLPLPKVKEISAEYAQVLSRKKQGYAEYRKVRDEAKDFATTKKIFEMMLGLDGDEKERAVAEKNTKEK